MTNTKKTVKKVTRPRPPAKTVDQLTLARLIAQKFEMTITSVLDIILEEQKLSMEFVGNGYKVIKKNYLTLEAREYKGKEWKSPLDKKMYITKDRKRVLVRVGEGFKHYLNEDKKIDDRLCRFVARKTETPTLDASI